MGKKIIFLASFIMLFFNFNVISKGNVSKKSNEVNFIMPKIYFNYNGYIYYVNIKDGYIYKSNGKDKKLISKDRVFTDDMILSGMIVYNNFIYYINENDNNRLYRIDKDGKEKICLTKKSLDTSDGFYILNGYIYYCSNFNIYKISMDGKDSIINSKEKEICTMYFNSFKKLIYNDEFYFLKRDGIYKMSLDGTKKCKVISGGIYDFQVFGSSIFYINEKDLCLYKDGVKIINNKILKDTGYEWIGNFEINNGYIFYTNADDDMNLYKMKINENKKISLNVKTVSFKVKDRIYYIDSSQRKELFSIDFTGKNKTKISKGELLFIHDVDNRFVYYSTKGDEKEFYIGGYFAVDKNNKNSIELN